MRHKLIDTVLLIVCTGVFVFAVAKQDVALGVAALGLYIFAPPWSR